MPRLTERAASTKLTAGTLRARQLGTAESQADLRIALQGAWPHIGKTATPRLGPPCFRLRQECSARDEQGAQARGPCPTPGAQSHGRFCGM